MHKRDIGEEERRDSENALDRPVYKLRYGTMCCSISGVVAFPNWLSFILIRIHGFLRSLSDVSKRSFESYSINGEAISFGSMPLTTHQKTKATISMKGASSKVRRGADRPKLAGSLGCLKVYKHKIKPRMERPAQINRSGPFYIGLHD